MAIPPQDAYLFLQQIYLGAEPLRGQPCEAVCQELPGLVEGLMEGTLPAAKQRRLLGHTALCPECWDLCRGLCDALREA